MTPEDAAALDVNPRRGLLKTLTLGFAGLVGLLPTLPALVHLLAPGRRRPQENAFVPAGFAKGLAEDRPRRVEILGQRVDAWIRGSRERLGAVWLRRTKGGGATALSAVCPHLGCAVDYRADAQRFECPCHGSTFDMDGRRVSGPAPRDMDALDVVVEEGVMKVRLVDYRQGVGRKIPL